MEILLSKARVVKLKPWLVIAGAVLCVPAGLAWVGAALYASGLWAGGAEVAEAIPLWVHIVIASLPLVGGVFAAIVYVRQLRFGHGDWRLLAVVAVAAALTVGTGVAAFAIFEPASAPAARGGRGGGGGGGGGGGAAAGGGASGGGGGAARPSGGGTRPSSGGTRPSGGASRPSGGAGGAAAPRR
jgi:hypothetical protein